jgi:hypothetical protein
MSGVALSDQSPVRRYRHSWHFGVGLLLLIFSACWREWLTPTTLTMKLLSLAGYVAGLALIGWSYDENSK